MPDSQKSIALPLAATIVGGCLLPAQFAINAALAGQLRSVTLTGAVSYLGGAVFLLVLAAVRGMHADWRAALRGPRWAWLGGAVGSAYIVGSVVLTRALGAGLATTLVIASQITVAILLDHTGALGLVQRRLNPARAAAVLLALAALAVRLWGLR